MVVPDSLTDAQKANILKALPKARHAARINALQHGQ
jgi:hypothetical protein